MWGGRGEVWDGKGEILLSDSLHFGYVPALEARAVISLQMNNLFGALLDINQAIQIIWCPGHSGNLVPRPYR